MKRIKIALTGGIGAGKSTVADLMRQRGAEVVSGDELGRKVLDEDCAVRSALVERFGLAVLNRDDTLNRAMIATRVFASTDESRWLTSLTFPGIYSRWQNAFESSESESVVFDAALIFEWKIQAEFDLIVVVVADYEIAYSRVSSRFHREDFERRIKSQLPVELKVAMADFVIRNNEGMFSLENQVEQFWNSRIKPLLA